MKISDSLLMTHFNVDHEQIEYTVKDKTTRVYIQLKLSGHFHDSELVIEFNDYNAQTFLITKGDGLTSSNETIKLLIAQSHAKGEPAAIALVLETKEQLRRLSEAFRNMYIETKNVPCIVAKTECNKDDVTDEDLELH